MSYDLAFWRQTGCVTVADASETYGRLRAQPPDDPGCEPEEPAVGRFVVEILSAHFPLEEADDPESSPWAVTPYTVEAGRGAIVSLAPDHAEWACEWLVEKASEHGLLTYDPQQGEMVWPDDARPEGVILQLGDGTRHAAPDRALVERCLRQLDPAERDFVILSRADEHYVQAAVDEDGWVLEHRAGSADAHFECTDEDLGLERVTAVFVAFLEGAGSVEQAATWEPLQLDDAR